ncbi:flagellar basal body rod protein FlgB [Lentibacillus sp. Marseille-P4043]|uniref:flagellar basal body rod protein FlgB n=1 Tax=Lentibacillus sp. Marseille-P4043 TaxID=2040293 RepID=UPI000D0B9768|nr:flagellar basal body rod protein FlgB [Lentibacillus sp. Marseille-P4043]
MDLFGGTFRTLENSLDYASVKNSTISNNIANVDTPNYKAKDVTFKNVLHKELGNSLAAKRTDPRHLPFNNGTSQNSYQINTKNDTMYNHNGNNVDIDKEMAELAENQIYYQSLVDRMNGKFRDLQTVVRGGR